MPLLPRGRPLKRTKTGAQGQQAVACSQDVDGFFVEMEEPPAFATDHLEPPAATDLPTPAAPGLWFPPVFNFWRDLTPADEAESYVVGPVKLGQCIKWSNPTDWTSWQTVESEQKAPVTAEVVVGPSKILHAGRGVRAGRYRIAPNTCVGYYIGREIHWRTAKYQRLRKEHTHCLTVWRNAHGRIIQGKPDAWISEERMRQFGAIGSLINTDPRLSKASNNCVFQHKKEYFQLCPGGAHMDVRVYVYTARWIEPGEELTVWLGEDIAAHIEESRLSWPEYQQFLHEREAYYGAVGASDQP